MEATEWPVHWPIVDDIMSVPWFKRLWIIQEAVLAKKGTLVLGHDRCDLQDVLRLTEIDFIRLRSLLKEENVDMTVRDNSFAMRCVSTVTVLRSVMAQTPDGTTQAHLIGYCRGRRCHDVRDYIFATTGMAERLGIAHEEIDYGLSSREAILNFNKSELYRDPNALLSSDGLAVQLDLPSWVQDPPFQPKPIPFFHDKFSAGGPRNACADNELSSLQPDVLVLLGFGLDQLSKAWKSNPDGSWQPGDVEYVEKDYIEDPMVATRYGGFLNQRQAFWRTIVADTRYRDHPPGIVGSISRLSEWPPDDSGTAYEVFMHRAEPREGRHNSSSFWELRQAFAKDFSQSLLSAANHRSILLTAIGLLGVGPKETQPGDQLVIIPGVNMPLVLRQKPDSYQYQLLGPAYVHGIMQGEFMKSLRANNELGRMDSFEIC